MPAGATTPRGESSQWGDYHAREVALYVKRLAEGEPYLAFFGRSLTAPTGHAPALVTGGTRGIGLGIARALARDGWNLALCGTRPEADVAATLDELRASGGAVGYDAADLASQRAIGTRLVDGDRARSMARVNALVNNAGRAPRAPRRSARRRRRQLRGADPHQPAGTVLPDPGRSPASRSRAARRTPSFSAAIVFITSVSADMASSNRGEYCVSKAGLSMAARLFAVRLAGHGIPVYEVRPGIIATDMTAGVKDAYDKRIADGLVPEGRWGTPDDVGRIVAALLRGDAPVRHRERDQRRRRAVAAEAL